MFWIVKEKATLRNISLMFQYQGVSLKKAYCIIEELLI